MNKPAGYDQAEARQFGGEKPTAGPYVMKIVQAKEVMSKTNRPMIVMCLDIATGPFAGNFKKLYDFLKSKNSEAKWPCVHRRCTDGNQLDFFKGDIKAVEESNPGYTFNFDEKTLSNKLVGCVLGEKEVDATGKTVLEPRFLCSTGKSTSGELKAPAVKRYAGGSSAGWNSDDAPPPDYDDNSLPF